MCFEAKKEGFPFVSLRSENNLVEAKRKIGSEKKQKNRAAFSSEQVKHTCERDPISLHIAYKRNNFLSEMGAP
jgi:hypothetical protein